MLSICIMQQYKRCQDRVIRSGQVLHFQHHAPMCKVTTWGRGHSGRFFLFGDREPFMQPFWLLILYQALCCGCRQTHCVGPESTGEIVNVVNAMNEYMQTDTFPNSSKGGLNLQSNDYRRTTGASFREYIWFSYQPLECTSKYYGFSGLWRHSEGVIL